MIIYFRNIPYRQTPSYARAAEVAKRQNSAMRHRTAELTPYQSRPSTSAIMRRPWFGFAR